MRYNIAMVSDFFYPNMGGVESHLYQLSQRLIQRGHKIIIITHSYGNRTGIRYLTNGLKVYYVPHMVIYSEATLPTIYGFFPIFRNIVKREKIDIVHGHQAFSSLCHEAILHSRTMGMKACFTDHSLFGFADASSILTNKLLKFTLSDIDHVICVSHTSKENTVLRAALNPQMVSVIPNAVVASQFKPDPGAQDPNFSKYFNTYIKVTIVVASRLVYRKGMDLLVAAIPRICQMHSKVKFIIGGDGPKRIDLEQMREKYLLHDRVELVGTLMQHEVRNLLTKGHIFLNTSLTEAFCIGIVEAACCGLLVVSTKVGGVPEVLPKHMIIFAKPEEDDLVNAVGRAIEMIRLKEVIPIKFHDEIKEMYSWVNVAERTEKVYDAIWKMRIPPLMERLRRYYGCGLWAGKIFCILIAIDYLIWRFLEWLFPEEDIEIAPAFPYQKYNKMCQMADKDDDD
ncbi:glycosyltransferase family 4 protein [Rhizophagus irregularis DAOM 181602=DAOM 197198]|uniref:Phosphatidylinositol N-acetylglucosaminyltransferase GPI3 subunit n=1 Tax=Rhizophagus irregularis (strain DAOM 181602 / DAOM 197198 / MUCL 43194) TaxID=747089 RepID=A0A2P4PZN4_RHIID|nr:glycosyltransferase family 4 protein [Rhizophagus irregularis DAOM 181602=DAOM 197198]POG70843.1 glycosyltransferase family 4 protein [Rhizophagus irregularis DAOM 181602=DAOM 197198]|eukprot:XP_025177709.1 glycosyltransferase family 4 protein [Rhizophagus irregularis DAOM 181602=DAOM 197198]